jgi:hypothetical protein
VFGPKTSPATIRLVLADPESDAATVQFFYMAPGSSGVEVPLARLAQNPVTLATSPAGTVHQLPWAFTGEASLPPTAAPSRTSR